MDALGGPPPAGTITLDQGPTTLVLRATQVPGASVADIRRVVLRPVREETMIKGR